MRSNMAMSLVLNAISITCAKSRIGLFDIKKEKVITTEYNELTKYIDFHNSLINLDRCVSKSEYINDIKIFEKTINYFTILNASDLLKIIVKRMD